MPGVKVHRSACALVLGAGLLAALASGCGSLERIDEQGCGNGVVNRNEDCDDEFSGEDPRCGEPGTPEACLYTCQECACPSGWECSPEDNLCRAPSGRFTPRRISFDSLGSEVALADINGDGRQDLVGSDGLEVTVHLGDEGEGFGETLSLLLPERSGPLHFGPFTPEVGDDMIVPTELGFYVVPGGEGAREPLNFPTAPLRDPANPTGSVSAIEAAELILIEADPGLPEVPDINRETLIILRTGGLSTMAFFDTFAQQAPYVTLPDPNGLAGRVATADVDGNGRSEILIAPTGDTKLYLYTSVGRTSGGMPEEGGLRPEPYAPASELLLGAPIVSPGATFADADGDQHADILAITSEKAGTPEVLLLRNKGDGTFEPAISFTALMATNDSAPRLDPRMPWVTADLNGDTIADYVFPNGIYLGSYNGPRTPEQPPDRLLQVASPPFDEVWGDAIIADINRDGWPDVVASLDDRLQLMRNGGFLGAPGFFTSLEVETTDKPRLMRSGDFDGDLVLDIAYVQGEGSDERVEVHFGAVSGSFGAPVSMGRLGNIAALAPVFGIRGQAGRELVSDLLVLHQPAMELPGSYMFTLMLGNPARYLVAPYVNFSAVPPSQGGQRLSEQIISALVGRFSQDPHAIALLTETNSQDSGDQGDITLNVQILKGTGSSVSTTDPGRFTLSVPTGFYAQCALWMVGNVMGSNGSLDEIIGIQSPAGCELSEDAMDQIVIFELEVDLSGNPMSLSPHVVSIDASIGPILRASLEQLRPDENNADDYPPPSDLVLVYRNTKDESDGGILIYWNDALAAPSPYSASSWSLISNILQGQGVSLIDAVPVEIDHDNGLELAALSLERLFTIDISDDLLGPTPEGAAEVRPLGTPNPIGDSETLSFGVGSVRAVDLNDDALDDIVVSASDTTFLMHNPEPPRGVALNSEDPGPQLDIGDPVCTGPDAGSEGGSR